MNQSKAPSEFENSMFLYLQPELLSVEEHGNLGLDNSVQPYGFARSIQYVPLAAAEIATAQKHYPVIFSAVKEPALMAVVGLTDDRNLFVDADGHWEQDVYVPSYLRCHPFALAGGSGDQFAVVIDRAAAAISDTPDQPFFDGAKLTPPIQARVDFCAKFSSHQPVTQAFCDRLAELELLSGQRATFTPEGESEQQTIASYVAVDFDRLRKLDAATLEKLFQDGMLGAIYAHQFSMENWSRLLERHQRSGAGAPGGTDESRQA